VAHIGRAPLLGVRHLQPYRANRFAEFATKRAFPSGNAQLGKLLRNGTATLDDRAGPIISFRCSRNPNPVYPPMLIEAAILYAENRVHQCSGNSSREAMDMRSGPTRPIDCPSEASSRSSRSRASALSISSGESRSPRA
jgi:hypothetical protein